MPQEPVRKGAVNARQCLCKEACGAAHFSYFWMVRSSTPPVRYRIWPPVVDLPASTCPMNTIFKCSLRGHRKTRFCGGMGTGLQASHQLHLS